MRQVATQAVGAVVSGRRGRPRADQAGEVEERVLDVATRLFLSHGFDRTTFEGLAEEAQAGKATLYARYRNKEALYEAVVRRRVAQSVARISAASDGGVSRENLLGVAMLLADEIFVPDVIALMRLTIAEVTRFPEMALATYRIGYGGCVSALAEIIAGQGHTPEMLVAATPAATRFVERVFMPLQMHALYGVDLPSLRLRAREDVAHAVDGLLAEGVRDVRKAVHSPSTFKTR